MSALCICGFCIPYNVLWPMLLFILKQLWDFFKGKKAEDAKGDKSEVSANKVNQPSHYHGYLGDLQDMDHYHQLKANTEHCDSILLLKFTAKWCKPCQALAPILEKVVDEQKDEVYAVSVDVDDFDELGAKYHAVLLPMMVAVQRGKEVERFRGKEEQELRAFLTTLTSAKKTK